MINVELSARAQEIGEYMLEHKCTVRDAAEYFGISKSTVHLDITKRLDSRTSLYDGVQKLLAYNKEQCHTRGGQSLKRKLQSAKAKQD